MKQKNKFWKYFNCLIYLLVIIFALLAISSRFNLGGIKLLVVKSGSMEPTIKTGSLVIDRTFKQYNLDEIITFKERENPNETITHRLINIEDENGIILYTTQGDANGTPDGEKITIDRIIGRVIFKIPYFGYIVAFTRTVPGVIILIVIPATIIIYDELQKIKNELKERKKRKEVK